METTKIITSMEGFFVKLPSLPKKAREVIVMITPWLALVFGAIGTLTALAGIGILGVFSPLVVLGAGVGTTTSSFVGIILALISSVLMLVATPKLFNRKVAGWKLLFWSEAVCVISAVVTFALGGLVSAFIGFYILFQIKSYYK